MQLCICAYVYLCNNTLCNVRSTIQKDLLSECCFRCVLLADSMRFVGQTLKGKNAGLGTLLQCPKMPLGTSTLNDRSVIDRLYHYSKNKRF